MGEMGSVNESPNFYSLSFSSFVLASSRRVLGAGCSRLVLLLITTPLSEEESESIVSITAA